MFDPNNMTPPAPGMVQTMGAPMTRPMFDRDAFRALAGRDERRDFRNDFNMDMQAYHDAMKGIKRPGQPGALPQAPMAPGMPFAPQALPQALPGMVGGSYGVQGMMPATSGFGMPTY